MSDELGDRFKSGRLLVFRAFLLFTQRSDIFAFWQSHSVITRGSKYISVSLCMHTYAYIHVCSVQIVEASYNRLHHWVKTARLSGQNSHGCPYTLSPLVPFVPFY